jgi:hypothetical protein
VFPIIQGRRVFNELQLLCLADISLANRCGSYPDQCPLQIILGISVE